MFKISQRMVITMTMLAATSGAALAQTVDPAKVAADAAAANKAGLVARGEIGAPEAKFVSTQSGDEVRSQAVAAVAAGQTARGEMGEHFAHRTGGDQA